MHTCTISAEAEFIAHVLLAYFSVTNFLAHKPDAESQHMAILSNFIEKILGRNADMSTLSNKFRKILNINPTAECFLTTPSNSNN